MCGWEVELVWVSGTCRWGAGSCGVFCVVEGIHVCVDVGECSRNFCAWLKVGNWYVFSGTCRWSAGTSGVFLSTARI